MAPYEAQVDKVAPSFDFGASFHASFLAEQCSAATSEGTCPLPDDLFSEEDNIGGFVFGRQEQPRVALSVSTASDAFSMHTLSTSGSSSNDLDELLTWLDKDVPHLGFKASETLRPCPARLGLAQEQQEVTSPVSQGLEGAQQPKKSFAVPQPRHGKGVPLLRIRIKSQAWETPVLVVAEAQRKTPFRGLPFTQPQRKTTSVGASVSAEVTCLQSCGSTQELEGFRSEGSGGSRSEGFGGFGSEAITKKRTAGGRHKRKDRWAGGSLCAAPILTNPVVTTFEADQHEVLTVDQATFVGTSGRADYVPSTAERLTEVDGIPAEEEEKSEPEYVDNISKRPGLRTVRRRVHVAAEGEEGGAKESPGRQAKWKRKAPRDAKKTVKVPTWVPGKAPEADGELLLVRAVHCEPDAVPPLPTGATA